MLNVDASSPPPNLSEQINIPQFALQIDTKQAFLRN